MEFLFWMEVKRNVGMEGEGERLRKRNVENGFYRKGSDNI